MTRRKTTVFRIDLPTRPGHLRAMVAAGAGASKTGRSESCDNERFGPTQDMRMRTEPASK